MSLGNSQKNAIRIEQSLKRALLSLQSLNVALRLKSAHVCETQKNFFLMNQWELVLKERKKLGLFKKKFCVTDQFTNSLPQLLLIAAWKMIKARIGMRGITSDSVEGYVTVLDHSIFYRKFGKDTGEKILCLHGGPGVPPRLYPVDGGSCKVRLLGHLLRTYSSS